MPFGFRERSEFEIWWDDFAKKRLRNYDEKEQANLCGIAKDAWNAAVEKAARSCEVVAELEGAKEVRKLKE